MSKVHTISLQRCGNLKIVHLSSASNLRENMKLTIETKIARRNIFVICDFYLLTRKATTARIRSAPTAKRIG